MNSSTLSEVKKQIKAACEKVMRDPSTVKILAVSKLQESGKIQKLISAGQLDFGENYVQELLQKAALPELKTARWHLIGHLQKNKVKGVVGNCALIHSVDSVGLAEEISKKSVAAGTKTSILFQVNTASEDAKEGFGSDELIQEFPKLLGLPFLEFKGLMTMPPLNSDAELNRVHFKNLRLLSERLIQKNNAPETFRELSMGTSQDFQVAVEEGATWVRVGHILFGARPHSK